MKGAEVYFAGNRRQVAGLVGALLSAPDDAAREAALRSADFLFALIIETGAGVVAATDRIRSTPVFHAVDRDGKFCVSNDARALRDRIADTAPDSEALLEIEMAGFVTGPGTVCRHLYQIESGAFLHLPAAGQSAVQQRYYRFLPADGGRTADHDLGEVLDRIFDGLVERADGRPVLVPVSGGLDSRLVLAKLAERRCPNLSAFSYGMPGNTDAESGRRVAERLGVAWRFVPSRPAAHRAFFRGPDARAFWRFADGLGCVPSPQDIVPLSEMRAAGLVTPGTIVVNGQTGDFLTGGHIPKTFVETDILVERIVDEILGKHYALWRSLASPANRARMAARVRALAGLPDAGSLPREEAVARHALWEFEGRQARWVVNAQRTYEYLGLDWELPLWQPALVDLFRDLPVDEKVGQRRYRAYLEKWDFAGLFAGFVRARSSWPRGRRALAVVEKAALLAGGAPLQARANAVLRYFGHYAHQTAELGFREFLSVRHDMRHIGAHHARLWLRDNGFAAAA
jgi:asparagine synthase (glutamine-hydrolysing)